MRSQNKSGGSSFFGGPLSTRESCRAALKKRQKVEAAPPKQELSAAPLKRGEARGKLTTRCQRETTTSKRQGKRLALPKDQNLTSVGPHAQPRRPSLTGKDVDRMRRAQMLKAAKSEKLVRQREEGMKRAIPTIRKGTQATVKATGFKRKQERNGEDGRMKVQRGPSVGREPRVTSTVQRRHLVQSRGRQMGLKRRPVPALPDDLKDFIDDGDEDDQDDVDWQAELRKTTNYHPSKFRDNPDVDDRCMESSLRQCWREERRSHVIGKLEDQRECERERKRKSIRP